VRYRIVFMTATLGMWFLLAQAAHADKVRFENAGGQQCWSDTYTEGGTTVESEFCCEQDEVLDEDFKCTEIPPLLLWELGWGHVAPGVGEPPNRGGVGLPPPPPQMPTRELCQAAGEKCIANLGETQRDCEAYQLNAVRTKIVNPPPEEKPGTCFGGVQDIVDRVLACAGSEDRLIVDPYALDNLYRLACRWEFQRIALDQCLNGVRAGSGGIGLSSSIPIKLGNFGSLGLTASATLSVDTPPGVGIRQHCAALGQQHLNKCTDGLLACNNAADALPRLLPDANLQTEDMRLDAEAQELMARIDGPRLGLENTVQPAITIRPGAGAAISLRGAFRPIQRNDTEAKSLWVARLRFLATWSEFLIGNDVTSEQQASAQLAFEDAQTTFWSAEARLARLTVNYLLPNPTLGAEGKRLAKLELLEYTQLKEYDMFLKAGENTLRTKLVNTLGVRKAEEFLKLGWKGIYSFGFAEPMSARREEAREP